MGRIVSVSVIYGLVTIIVNVNSLFDNACVPRSFGHDSVVCVCNGDYCDYLEPIHPFPNQFAAVSTSRDGDRMAVKWGEFRSQSLARNFIHPRPILDRNTGLTHPDVSITIHRRQKYQQFMGFGGAITDSAGLNIKSLTRPAQQNLLQAYFGYNGIGYSYMRVPIAGCDFSTRGYTYDDVPNDINLTHFNLTFEDYLYKIPVIVDATKIHGKPINLISSVWSAPAWMKEVPSITSFSALLPKYYQTWANYFVRFIELYKKNGIQIGMTTVQNEGGFTQTIVPINSMQYNGAEARAFTQVLGKTFHDRGINTKIIIGDDNFDSNYLPTVETVLLDPATASYVSGVAAHGYLDNITTYSQWDLVKSLIGDRFFLHTEYCAGVTEKLPVILGGWLHAATYIQHMLQVFLHSSRGFIDWNLALDVQGGPNWVKNFVDAPIIVNATANEFYKQPIFYVIGQLSKFIPANSWRIDADVITNDSNSDLRLLAAITPLGEIVVVIYNPYPVVKIVRITENTGRVAALTIGAESVTTVIYRL